MEPSSLGTKHGAYSSTVLVDTLFDGHQHCVVAKIQSGMVRQTRSIGSRDWMGSCDAFPKKGQTESLVIASKKQVPIKLSIAVWTNGSI